MADGLSRLLVWNSLRAAQSFHLAGVEMAKLSQPRLGLWLRINEGRSLCLEHLRILSWLLGDRTQRLAGLSSFVLDKTYSPYQQLDSD